jgi:hypothetical protein
MLQGDSSIALEERARFQRNTFLALNLNRICSALMGKKAMRAANWMRRRSLF